MEDDAELLDWGGEEDEHTGERPFDTEDVVSIGGEEDDMQELAAYRKHEQAQDVVEASKASASTLPSSSSSFREPKRDASRAEQTDPLPNASSPPRSSLKRSSSARGLPFIPGLPAKPVVTADTFRDLDKAREPARPEKERRRVASVSNGVDGNGALPPNWEVRHPRSADSNGQIYYYNTMTHKSKWDRPSFDEENGDTEHSRGIENTRAADDLDRGRSDRYPDATSKRPPSPLPGSPSEDSHSQLTFDDRHYRPTKEPPTRSHRERRNSSPVPPKHHGHHDDRTSDSISSYKRGERGFERVVHEDPGLSSRAPSSRPYDERTAASKSTYLGSAELSSKAAPKTQQDVHYSERAWMERHDSLSTVSRSPDSRPRQAQDLRENVTAHMQFKEPLPRQTALVSETKSRHRRHVSRSPPPHIEREQDRRLQKVASTYELGQSEFRSRPEISDSGRNESVVRASRLRNDSPPSRRLADTYLHPDLNSRRTREPELNNKELMGQDAKRRRTDERTTDSAYARRGRSPILEGRPRAGSVALHESRSGGTSREPDYKRSYLEKDRRSPSPAHVEQLVVRVSGETREYKIPSGPRYAFASHDAPLPDERGASLTRNFDHREPRMDRISKDSEAGRRTGRYVEVEGRGEDYPPRRENGTRPMDVDIPVPSSFRDDVYGDIVRGGGTYGDRPELKTKDSTPTAPRAMATKAPSQLPPQPPFGPKGSRFAPQDNGWPARDRPPVISQRSSRFGESHRPDDQQSPSVGRDTVDRQGGLSERPIELPHRVLPYPAGPKALEKSSRQGQGPSPKLTGANNIAVPPSKGWTVNPPRKDDNVPSNTREERQNPPHMRSGSRWETARDASEDLRLEAPVRMDRTQSAPYPSRRDEFAHEVPVLIERLPSSDRISHERGSSRRDDDPKVSPQSESRRTSRFDRPAQAEIRGQALENEDSRKWIPRNEVPEGYEERWRGGSRRDQDYRSGVGELEPEPLQKTHRVHGLGSARSGSLERNLEGDRPNVRPLPAYNERDQERAFVAREPPVDLGPGDRYHTSRKPAPSAYPAERIEEAPRERKLDSNRFSGDVRKPPPADDAVKVHPSRLSMVLVPPPLDKGIESRLTDPESGNQSRAGGPVRIRRPNTKFGDSVNVVARLGPFSEDKDFVVDEHERRPQAARTSSLLERLNMASSGEPIPAPSLRERVDFPPNSRDNASAKEDSKDDVYFPDNGDDEGDSRRAPWKGRSRSNRPRRSRGRGPYGNV